MGWGRYSFWKDLVDGNKSFGEKLARRVEEAAASIPRGWLDVPGADFVNMAPEHFRAIGGVVQEPPSRRESLNTQLEELLLNTFRRFDSDADRLAALNAMNDQLSNRLGRRGAHDPFGKPSPAQKHPVRGMSQFGELDEPPALTPAKTKSGGGRR